MVHLLSINTTFKETDNNDGFTVLDITNPANARYAFFFESKMEAEDDSETSVPGLTLLRPQSYAVPYGCLDYDCVETCDKLPKLRLDAIKSLWPDAEWTCEYDDKAGDEEAVDVSSTLRELSLSRVIEEALQTDLNESTWMQHAEQLPDFLSTLRARIQTQPSLVPLQVRENILVKAFADCEVVDLSSFFDLRPTELLSVSKGL